MRAAPALFVDRLFGGILERMMLLRLLGYLWATPQTLAGLLLAIWYRPHTWRWSDGCLEAIADEHINGRTRMWGEPVAQTWGWMIYYASDTIRRDPEVRVHERVHVVQGMLLGVLFLLAYAFHFIWLFAFPPRGHIGDPRWVRAYNGVWAERQAFKYQDRWYNGERPNAWGSRRA